MINMALLPFNSEKFRRVGTDRRQKRYSSFGYRPPVPGTRMLENLTSAVAH